VRRDGVQHERRRLNRSVGHAWRGKAVRGDRVRLFLSGALEARRIDVLHTVEASAARSQGVARAFTQRVGAEHMAEASSVRSWGVISAL
jgi:hypothetical protein